MDGARDSRPVLDAPGRLTRAFEAACLVAAGLLLAANVVRLAAGLGLRWWMVPVVVIAGVAADLVSGLVHWSADTWGRDTLPVLGPRFLRPFRVHHVNPQDFLRRGFIDCNGDVAMLNAPLLGAALCIRSTPERRRRQWRFTAFAAWSLPTNQVHQWAHMPTSATAGPMASGARRHPRPRRAPRASRGAVRDELLHRHGLVQSQPGAARRLRAARAR